MTPSVLWTLPVIARRIGVAEEETVLAYARRARDPLRLRFIFGKYWIKTARLDAWKARQQPRNACPRVEGMAEIAMRLGLSVPTVRAFARRERDPLPLEWRGRRAWIYEHALLDWYDAQDRPAGDAGGPAVVRATDPVPLSVASQGGVERASA